MPNRIAPEKGIEVSADERASLEASVEELGGLIDGLRDHQLIADIIIFYNAARYALDQDIFYDKEDVAKGADLIAQGIERQGHWPTIVPPGQRHRVSLSVDTGRAWMIRSSPMDWSSLTPMALILIVSADSTSGITVGTRS